VNFKTFLGDLINVLVVVTTSWAIVAALLTQIGLSGKVIAGILAAVTMALAVARELVTTHLAVKHAAAAPKA